jgi:uncharacterized membrane protein YphA (DoxX/SURF4 family)
MVRLTPIYPDGLTGGALLLMRVSYAALTLSSLGLVKLSATHWWVGAAGAGALSLALAGGLATRWAALLLTLGLTAAAFSVSGEVAALMLPHAGAVAALGLLGPGAFSIDAHLFGRRVIRLDPRRSDEKIDR